MQYINHKILICSFILTHNLTIKYMIEIFKYKIFKIYYLSKSNYIKNLKM